MGRDVVAFGGDTKWSSWDVIVCGEDTMVPAVGQLGMDVERLSPRPNQITSTPMHVSICIR